MNAMRQENSTPGGSRYELIQLIRLALPLVAAQLAQMGMGVVDTIMAGQVGALELAGVALGGAVLLAHADVVQRCSDVHDPNDCPA